VFDLQPLMLAVPCSLANSRTSRLSSRLLAARTPPVSLLCDFVLGKCGDSTSLVRICVAVRIIKSAGRYKFKVRTSRYLYTIVINDKAKAEKLKQSLNEST
jgi:hypothetical protein